MPVFRSKKTSWTPLKKYCNMIEFRMPSLGADMEAGTLVEWLVKPGDVVKRGDVIALVDTQKGLFDIEVFEDGTVENLVLKEGAKVPVGTVMAVLNGTKETVQKEKAPSETGSTREASTQATSLLKIQHAGKASPLAKRMAEELGVDLATIKGTGEEGAITKADVEKAAAEKKGAPEQSIPAETSQKTPLPKERTGATATSIRMAVAAAMTRSNREIPHYYLETKIDMRSALHWLAEANRQRPVKDRLLPVALYIWALARALTEVPQMNAWWEEGLQLKEQINIGFVISLRTGGIMIPSLHDAEKKSVDEIMAWINEIIPRTRALNLRSSDIGDTTITMTSLAEGSAEAVYGVIYPPQVALLGLGGITEQPWAENGMLAVRPVLTATLSADHRASAGQIGNRFLMAFKNYLQQPEKL
jgi:pyruvate dehydrogenase E2 component (dihydrolipoamide acetyltransferase)